MLFPGHVSDEGRMPDDGEGFERLLLECQGEQDSVHQAGAEESESFRVRFPRPAIKIRGSARFRRSAWRGVYLAAGYPPYRRAISKPRWKTISLGRCE
jgi:hypothetical protein